MSQKNNEQINTTGEKKKSGFLNSLFNSFSFLKENKSQPLAIAGALLLSTTALTPSILTLPFIGAAGLMAGSFYLLTKTSDIVVDNASALGKKVGVSALTLGVALGAITSLPELFVSIGSIFQGTPDIGIGNIVGSNIANILLILGVTAAITKIKEAKGVSWKFNTLSMLGATAAFGGLMATGALPTLGGVGLLGLLAAYKVGSYIYSKKDAKVIPQGDDNTDPKLKKLSKSFNALWGLAGVAGVVCSADVLINSASHLALSTGISPAIVGALAVSIGTSLPELVVNVKAALKGETQMAIGNVLGSNVFNLLMVGGALGLANTAIPEGFSITSDLGKLNMGFFGASAALLAASLYKNKGGLTKKHGYVALSLYAAYTAASFYLNGPIEPNLTHNIETAQIELQQPEFQIS
jgi:cation:H+ antiporter